MPTSVVEPVVVRHPELIGLGELMRGGGGQARVRIAVIDGPARLRGLGLEGKALLIEPGGRSGAATCDTDAEACAHGTFVAGLLCGRDVSPPSICPGCTLMLRPIFGDHPSSPAAPTPAATPEDLARAVVDAVDAGAHVLNLSAGLAVPSSNVLRSVYGAIDYAARRGVLIVAAAGNQGLVAGSCLTQHPWVIPVVACDGGGYPLVSSNLSPAVARRGVAAPGDGYEYVDATGRRNRLAGTSAAAPWVTGTLALLLSFFPNATAAAVRHAILGARKRGQGPLVPVLDARAAYDRLRQSFGVSHG